MPSPHETCGTFDLSDRAILKLTGADAKRYLNGQISQDVSLASESEVVYSIVANFKGKLEGDLFVRIHQGDILIDTTSAQRESLFQRLDKYLIADDAELIDVSDQFRLYHHIGEVSEAYSAPLWTCNRLGIDGFDLLIERHKSTLTTLNSSDYEQLRIRNAIPAWGSELTESTLPAEAGLEARAISYTKGCYTGQEIISRMKSAGKTNKHLVPMLIDREISPPSDLHLPGETDARPSATLTSICQIDQRWIGLGFRTRKALAHSTFTSAGGAKVTISDPSCH